MAAVGRARLKTESLINSQKSRALYGEAGEKDIERRQRLFRAFAAREHGGTPAEPQRSTSEEESILEEFCKVKKNTNARPGTLQAAPACNAPNPGENDGIRKNEEKKRGEGLATGNQNGYG